MSLNTDDLQALSKDIEGRYPGKTVVLNAATREVIVASQNPSEIASKLKTLGDDIVTLFIGGPFGDKEFAFHHFCSSPKA